MFDKFQELIMEHRITLDDLRLMAQRAGLRLADNDLERLLSGVHRAKKQADELRSLISLETEPAATLRPQEPSPK